VNGRRLLIASDGLFRFASSEKLLHVARRSVLSRAPESLVDLVRLRNGELQDGVAIIVCEEVAEGDAHHA
jgi:serine/threonine protein phosphatase PrpC